VIIAAAEVKKHVFCEKPIDTVFAECGDIDTAVTTLTFKNGAIGVIDNSRKAEYGYDQRVEVFGSKGCVAVGNDFYNTAQLSTEPVYRIVKVVYSCP
jgi:myo-inositol 2-dehydrogenase / D-chiro-inositol 1-dehydrogenase